MNVSQLPSAQYSITLRLEYPHEPGWIAAITSVIAQQGGVIDAIDLVHIHKGRSVRDYTIECRSAEQEQSMIEAIKGIEGITVESAADDTFRMHVGGKLEIRPKVPLDNRAELSMAYTPGVARICRAIHQDTRMAFNLTIRKNCVAVVSDGSAVLGLGNIGPEAAMPVMEGKAILFKKFGDVDAFPLCIDTQDTEEIIQFCRLIAPTFGGINLEDISSPRCFEIESRLDEELNIPVFHDDQHGTAVVVLAGLINALKITGRRPSDMKLVVVGAGAAGAACSRTLKDFGVEHIIICDSQGAIYEGRDIGANPVKQWIVENTNKDRQQGSLTDVLRGADMLLGLSRPALLTRQDILTMNKAPIVFAMANPTPEVMPEEAAGVAAIMATGRSDYPNQINNVLAFPGIFRGALDARATTINAEMQQAAAYAIAGSVSDDELLADYIIPSVFNLHVAPTVARAVSKAAHRSGVAHRMPMGVKVHV